MEEEQNITNENDGRTEDQENIAHITITTMLTTCYFWVKVKYSRI